MKQTKKKEGGRGIFSLYMEKKECYTRNAWLKGADGDTGFQMT
jgi:hypothetical protein